MLHEPAKALSGLSLHFQEVPATHSPGAEDKQMNPPSGLKRVSASVRHWNGDVGISHWHSQGHSCFLLSFFQRLGFDRGFGALLGGVPGKFREVFAETVYPTEKEQNLKRGFSGKRLSRCRSGNQAQPIS